MPIIVIKVRLFQNNWSTCLSHVENSLVTLVIEYFLNYNLNKDYTLVVEYVLIVKCVIFVFGYL